MCNKNLLTVIPWWYNKNMGICGKCRNIFCIFKKLEHQSIWKLLQAYTLTSWCETIVDSYIIAHRKNWSNKLKLSLGLTLFLIKVLNNNKKTMISGMWWDFQKDILEMWLVALWLYLGKLRFFFHSIFKLLMIWPKMIQSTIVQAVK